MTAKTTDPGTGTEATPGEDADGEGTGGGGGLTLKGVIDEVRALARKVDSLGRRGGDRGRAGDGEEVARQVREEVGKIKQADDQDRSTRGRIAELEAKVREITEKPPREYRRVTRIMWGDDGDAS